MNEIVNAIRQFLNYFRLWVIIPPWDKALRVRLGKHVALLQPGIHLRLSIIDSIYSQNLRQRICGLGRQTTTSRDGKTITFTGAVGYAIADIEKLYRSLHHAEDTISNLARSAIADYISNHDLKDCHPAAMQKIVGSELNLDFCGLCDVRIYITEFATVRTYRLIGDYGSGSTGSQLTVESHDPPLSGPR